MYQVVVRNKQGRELKRISLSKGATFLEAVSQYGSLAMQLGYKHFVVDGTYIGGYYQNDKDETFTMETK